MMSAVLPACICDRLAQAFLAAETVEPTAALYEIAEAGGTARDPIVARWR